MHILAAKINSIKKITNQTINSFDQDFFTKYNTDLTKIYFVKNSQENILLTVESATSERNNDPTDQRSITNMISNNYQNLIYLKMRKEKNLLNIYSFLYSNYYVVQKKYLSKIKKCKFIKSLNFIHKIFPKNKNLFRENDLNKIKFFISKEDSFQSRLYDAVTQINFEKYIRKQKNKIGELFASVLLLIVILIPKSIYPIINKIFSRKSLIFNKARNSYKFILLGSPKKYILKHCIRNILKILKYA